MTNAIDVVFALRADAIKKPGGDTSKVPRYREFLAKRGLTSAVVYSVDDLRELKPAVVHVLNIDLPVENAAYARAARSKGARVVLSTIAHPLEGLRKFYSLGNDTYFRRLVSARVPFDQGFGSRELVKLAGRRDLRAKPAVIRRALSMARAQSDLVQACDLLLPMNQAENSELSARFSNIVSTSIVPNGVSFADHAQERGLSRSGVIVVGRIEPRKNSLEFARVAREFGLKVSFAGAANTRHRSYLRAFEAVVKSSRNVEWLGNLDRGALREKIAESSFYVNPSWYEVVSQADFEAAALSCQVLTTENSYIADHFDSVSRFAPEVLLDPASASSVLRMMTDSVAPEFGWLPSWDEAGESLIAAYEVVNR